MSGQIRLRSRNVAKDYTAGGRGRPRLPTWADILDRNLRKHVRDNAAARPPSGGVEEPLNIESLTNMEDEEVVNAIATFWIALLNQPEPQRVVVGYGSTSLFKVTTTGVPEAGLTAAAVIPRSSTFLMPLLFGEDIRKQYEKIERRGKPSEDIGHYLLALSSRDVRKPTEITTTIMDSSVSDDHSVRAGYQGLVTHSGWLGVNSQGIPQPITPNFVSQNVQIVPKQQGNNTCGLYVVLNAWAHMLRIPVTNNQTRRRSTSRWRAYKQFHETARQIINLAWAGHMDSKTVQAFMNVYGYSSQNLRVEEKKPSVRKVKAVRMDRYTLPEIIEAQKAIDQVEASGG